jgi:hypothetical protein
MSPEEIRVTQASPLIISTLKAVFSQPFAVSSINLQIPSDCLNGFVVATLQPHTLVAPIYPHIGNNVTSNILPAFSKNTASLGEESRSASWILRYLVGIPQHKHSVCFSRNFHCSRFFVQKK